MYKTFTWAVIVGVSLLSGIVRAQQSPSWLGDSTKRYQLEFVSSYLRNHGSEHSIGGSYVSNRALNYTANLSYASYDAKAQDASSSNPSASISNLTLDAGVEIRPPTVLSFLYAGGSVGITALLKTTLIERDPTSGTETKKVSTSLRWRPTIIASVGTRIALTHSVFWSIRLRNQIFKDIDLGGSEGSAIFNLEMLAVGMGLMLQL